MNNRRKVVITGMGIISPLGIGIETFWNALLDGICGINRVTNFSVDSELFVCKIAAEVPDFNPWPWIPGEDPTLNESYAKLALPALGMAIKDSGLNYGEEILKGAGLYMGSAQETGDAIDSFLKSWLTGKIDRLPPDIFSHVDPHAVTAAASRMYGINGHAMSITASCASGVMALMVGTEQIRIGKEEICVAVGADAISPSIFLGEGLTGELAKRNDDPEHASRPFDRDQDGYVIGEGAVAFVVETETHARARGANIYAELGRFSSTSDATSFKYIDEEGTQMSRGMEMLLKKISVDEIDYINAHGPSVLAVDKAECTAIRRAFGETAKNIPVTSIKGAIGNPSAAGGMLQVASSVLSIRDNVIPPTINLETPLPGCELNFVNNGSQQKNINTVFVSTHGGGGINLASTLNRWT